MKLGRCFEFLNCYYGFTQGGNHGNQYTMANEKTFNLPNLNSPKNQIELAESYGITQQTMNNYMRMAIETLAYDTKEEVMEWMINTQLGRRNLPPAQRLAVMDKFKKKIQEQARERQSEAGKEFGNGKNSSSPNGEKQKNIHTDKELAKIAGVGTGTVARFNKVMNSDDEELKKKVLANEVSINAGYKELTHSKEERQV